MIIICSISLGFMLKNNLKQKVLVCDEIVSFCDKALIDVTYLQRPIDNDFLNEVRAGQEIKTILSKEENIKLNDFYKSFGKSDVNNEITKLNNLKDYFTISRNEYEKICTSKSKIYISLSIGIGIIISILII